MFIPQLKVNGVEVNRPNSGNESGLSTSNAAKTYFTNKLLHDRSFIKHIDPTIDWDRYKKYGIEASPMLTEYDVKKLAAKYQSNQEKLGRAVFQGIYNEAIIGTLKGFSDLIDVTIAGISKDKTVGEYTNPVTKMLEEYQEQIRYNREIFVLNPEKAFDFNDVGWWANGFVNVATTLSLLIPSGAVTKGISLIPKAIVKGMAKAGKANRSFSLMGNAIMRSDKLRKAAALTNIDIGNAIKGIDGFTDVATTAFFSRTLENRQEARENFKIVKENTLQELANMSAKERADFYARNADRNYANMTDDQIASDIANISSGEVFKNDYNMLFVDILQFAGINKLLSNRAFSKVAGKNMKIENEIAKKSLTKSAQQYSDDMARRSVTAMKGKGIKGKWADIKQNGIDKIILGNSLIFGFEAVSEGFEEIYQGIQNAKGMNLAERILDPEVTERTLNSYLNDPTIWEQGFWGMIGGMFFQGAGAAINKIAKERFIKQNRDKLTDQQITEIRYGIQRQQLEDIKRRRFATERLYSNLNDIDNGLNPFSFKKDDQGNVIKIDGNPVKEEIDEVQAAILKNRVLDNYLVDLYFSSYRSNTTPLLREFINSPEFANAMIENTHGMGNNATEFNKNINKRFNQIASKFDELIYRIGVGEYEKNPFATEAYAKQILNDIVRGEQDAVLADYFQNLIDIEMSDIDSSSNSFDITGYQNSVISKMMHQKLTILRNKIAELDRMWNTDEISLSGYKHKRNEYRRIMNRFTDIIRYGDLFSFNEEDNKRLEELWRELSNDENFYEFLNILNYNTIGIDEPNNNKVKRLVELKAAALIDKYYTDAQIPNMTNTKEIQDGYEEFSFALDRYIQSREANALKVMEDFIINSDNPEQAFRDIINENFDGNEILEDAAEVLMLGKRININDKGEVTQDLRLVRLLDIAREKRNDLDRNARNNNENSVPTVEQQDENVVDELDDQANPIIVVDEAENEEVNITENEEETPISTGEETRSVEEPVIDIYGEEQIDPFIDDVVIEPDPTDIQQDGDVFISETEIMDANARKNVSEYIRKLIFDTFKNNINLFKEMVKNGYTKSKVFIDFYNDIIARVKDYMTLNGYNIDNLSIQQEIATYINLVGQSASIAQRDDIKSLGKDILTLHKELIKPEVISAIDKIMSNFSTIAGVETNELDKVFETFYEEYTKQNGIVIRKNNADETLIDIESVLNYIVFNDALTEEEKVLLVQNLIAFGENVNGFRFINTVKTYNKYKSSPQSLINKIKQNRKAKDLSLIEDNNTMRIEGALNTLAITVDNAISCYNNDIIKDPNVASAINVLEHRNNHTKEEINKANKIIKQYINNFIAKNIKNDKYRLSFTTDDNNTVCISLIDRATGKTIVDNIGFLTSIEGDATNNKFGIKPEIFHLADLINNHGFLWSIEEVVNGAQTSYIDAQIDNYFMKLIEAAANVNVMTNPQTAAEKLLAMLLSRNKTDNTDNIYFDPNNAKDQQEVIDFLTNDLIKYLSVGEGFVGRFGCRIQIGGSYRNVKLNTAAGNLSIEYFDSKGNVTISTNTVDLIKVANVILSQTNHILFHSLNESKDGNGNISKDVLEASYNNFKKKAYQNYKRQYEFANAIRKNGDVDASFARYEREYFNFDTDEALSPSELDRTLNSTNNPIVRSNGIYDIIIEGVEEPIELYNFDRYESDMGILLTNPQKERPIVAWITNENMRDLEVADTETHSYDINRRKLGEAIKGEINRILQEYENSDKTDEDFEKIYKAISQLVGGANTSRKGLFSGVDVFYSKKSTGSAISIILNNQPIGDKKLKDVADIVILKDDNKFKDGLVLYKQNDGKRKGKVISKEIDTLTNVLFKSIRFNKSFYMFTNSKVETDTESTNPYYRKKDGKLNITIGSYNKSYDTYSQFLYINNAFKLPLKMNEDGSIRTIRELNDRTPSFVIQYDFNNAPSSPVEKTVHIYNEDAIKELIEQREDDGKINTTKLLTNTNIDKRYLQFLFGDNAHNVKLLDSDIYYEETPPKNSKGKVIINGMYYGRYDNKTGRIYLAKSGLEYILNIGSNNEFDSYNETLREDLITNKKSTELQRIVLHENLHKRIDENSAIKNDETVDGLINTLISTVESLATSEHSRKKVIENWLNKFVVINNGKLDLDATIERFAKEKGVKVDKRYIAEEWIVEVLSNQALIDYLANTKYALNGKEIEVAEVKDKSIFQKIIDILLEIFGINLENTEKNSIFAEQYRLLNADNTITTNTVKRTRNSKNNKETAKKQRGKKPKAKATDQLTITFDETGTGETGTSNQSGEVKASVDEANKTIEDILASIGTEENGGITNEPNLDDLPGMFSTVDGIFTEEEIILNNYKQNGDINAYGIISAPNVNSFLAMFPIEEQPLIAENIKNGGVKYLC
jgi:molybdopterin converting factor small subunit